MFNEALTEAANQLHIPLTEKQREDFDLYHRLLLEWNEKMNLTAITDPAEIAVKHMIDSLSCCDGTVFKRGARIIDVGTGAGFPGLPLKIWREDIRLTLLDSLNKRVSFLKAVVEELKLKNVENVHGRAEDAGKNGLYREQYDVAVSRAVARLNILCELCLPFVCVGGYFVALKGAKYREEAEGSARALQLLGGKIEKIKLVKLPGLDDARAVIYIKKIKNTGKLYPRKAGTPEKSPL